MKALSTIEHIMEKALTTPSLTITDHDGDGKKVDEKKGIDDFVGKEC